MERFNQLIGYFREYDLYSNMLSHEIRDKRAIDVLLQNCTADFITSRMAMNKIDKIFNTMKKQLDPKQFDEAKQLIASYVDDDFSLEELVDSLPLTKKLYEKKSKVDELNRCKSFHVYYPIFYNKLKRTQQSLLTFSCELEENSLHIVKLFVNKDILTLIIASQNDLELADARTIYAQQLDELSTAVDAIRGSQSFVELHEMVSHQFNQIFKAQLDNFAPPENWQPLDKATVSFEPADDVIDSCFRDELETLVNQYEKDSYMPETVQRFLGLSKRQTTDIANFSFSGIHSGSYQADYPVNQKQWQMMQLAKESQLLCVDGPPGTGKTTLLKELIAEELVLKADALLEIWEEDWTCLGDTFKGIYRSPLEGRNKHSIVISSTNNKAIDNIGLELLKEIEYFSDLAATIENKEHKFLGTLCARLGRSDNVKDFYEEFYADFCTYLNKAEISKEQTLSACEKYCQIREELDLLNGKISTLLMYKDRFPNISSYGDLANTDQKLQQNITVLAAKKLQLDRDISDCKQQQFSFKTVLTDTEKEKADSESQLQGLEAQIRTLYADLQEYEHIGGFKRGLSFLFPKTKTLLNKYGSSKQINDEIEIIRNCSQEKLDELKKLDDRIDGAVAQLKLVDNTLELLNTHLVQVQAQLEEQTVQKNTIALYLDCSQELSRGIDIDFINIDVYHLRNLPVIMELRHKLFTAAIGIFETYIILHKEPILHNLQLVLTKTDGSNGAFYSWCWSAQNLFRASDEEKQTLIRCLWETFFLCFPVVTTTLHSFRKKTFAFTPELFDILMLDESGQIVPYYVIAPLYRANRAVLVGDANQIEPIKNVPARLLEKKYIEQLGDEVYNRFCIDTASAQSYAANASDFVEMIGGHCGGVILNEHRRCEPSIMAFSNRHIYSNVLSLIGDNDHDKLYGHNLVAFDVRGFKAKEHYNQTEIDACKQIVEQLVMRYGEAVKDDIGVITPFSRQAEKLKQAISGVEIGTVHVFQGAEKKYILFSCVLDNTTESAGLYNFVGGKGNLLNVAFSRAKKQFIFVGNFQAARDSGNYLKLAIDVFSEKGRLFSLFDTELLENSEFLANSEIVRILTNEQNIETGDEIGVYLRKQIPQGIIAEPKLHNDILNNMLLLAKKSVHIISPWIGSNVVTDDMLKTIKSKLENNVPINIIFGHRAVNSSLDDIDDLVQRDIPWRKEDAATVICALRALLGEALRYAPPSHIKLLLVDDRYLFIGSLNWLFNSGKTLQKEISCLITNPNQIAYVKEHFIVDKIII